MILLYRAKPPDKEASPLYYGSFVFITLFYMYVSEFRSLCIFLYGLTGEKMLLHYNNASSL